MHPTLLIVALYSLMSCAVPTPPSNPETTSAIAQTSSNTPDAESSEDSEPVEGRSASVCDRLERSEDPPLRLVLDQPEAGELRATLCNTSSRPQRTLVSPCLQPIMLELEHPDRGAITPWDSRSVRSCSGLVYAAMFETIESGGERVIEQQRIERDEASVAHLRFGTLHFTELPPATYRAQARLHVSNRHSEDEGRMADVWTGQLASEIVELVVEDSPSALPDSPSIPARTE